jgi:hypothetical protein
MRLILLSMMLVMLSACGGTYTAKRTAAPLPKYIQAIAVSPQEGNSPEVDRYLNSALVDQGLIVKAPLAKAERTNLEVDAIISYQDVWRWDLFTTHMRSISMAIYDAKSGNMLVHGTWECSTFHDYDRGQNVTKNLLRKMLEKTREKP